MSKKLPKERTSIDGIPAIEWGPRSSAVYVAVHGYASNKEDVVVALMAEVAAHKGVQILSFDLPEHGERKGSEAPCTVRNGMAALRSAMAYARSRWETISLFACSIGAYFSLLTYGHEPLRQALFLSPVVDMMRLIDAIMQRERIPPERLEREGAIATNLGPTLYWDCYRYVQEHPIDNWSCPTAILHARDDAVCEYDLVRAFSERFRCSLDIAEDGEHHFHTALQLKTVALWMQRRAADPRDTFRQML